MLKATDQQIRVLGAVQLDADSSIEALSKAARMNSHSVQYAITRLTDAGALQPFSLINPHALGLNDFCLFLNPVGHTHSLYERVARVLAAEKRIAYAVQLAGEFAFSISCFGTSVVLVDDILATLRKALPDVAWSMAFALRLEWTIIPRSYLGEHKKQVPLTRSVDCELVAVDRKDLQLLGALSQNPELPLSRVAALAGLPEATARLRVKRLVEQKVLLGKPYHIEASAVSRLAYRVAVSVQSRDTHCDAEFRAFAVKSGVVSDFVVCLGAWEYEFNIQVRDPAEIGSWINSLYSAFPGRIREVRSMGEVKILKLHRFDFSKLAPPA